MQVGQDLQASIAARVENQAAERREFVSAMATLFLAGKASAVHLGERLTKWELVEVLESVGYDGEAKS
jgi:hypothetical protein